MGKRKALKKIKNRIYSYIHRVEGLVCYSVHVRFVCGLGGTVVRSCHFAGVEWKVLKRIDGDLEKGLEEWIEITRHQIGKQAIQG